MIIKVKYVMFLILVICIFILTGCNSERLQEEIDADDEVVLDQEKTIAFCNSSGEILVMVYANGGHGSFNKRTISSNGIYLYAYQSSWGSNISYAYAKMNAEELDLFLKSLESFDVDSFTSENTSHIPQYITFMKTNKGRFAYDKEFPKFIQDVLNKETKACIS